MMGEEKKHRVDVATIRMPDWRKVAYHWIVAIVVAAILYWHGGVLAIWEKFFPGEDLYHTFPGFMLCFATAGFLHSAYTQTMVRLVPKPLLDGLKYVQIEDYDAALESFKQLYDLFDRHPGRERLHMLLLLNANRHSYLELALLNQSNVYIELGNLPEALNCLERCLSLNPENESATSKLNGVAAILGGELRPMPGQILFRFYDKRLRRSKLGLPGCLSVGLFLTLTLCFISPFIHMLATGVYNWYDPYILFGVLVFSLFTMILLRCIRWVIAQLVLRHFYRGERFYVKCKYREGVQAFRQQLDLLEKKPWIDNWRRLLLPPSGNYGYREWSLIRMAYGYSQRGEGDQLLSIYERVLALNPNNGAARSNIRFINRLRGMNNHSKP